MSKQDVEIKAPETQVAGLKLAFTSVCMAASLLFDVYVMINQAKLIWLIGIASLVFIITVYFFVNSILVLKYSTQAKEEEMYDDLFKSSKATYLMMKKYFDEVEEQLEELLEKSGIPQEEIINAQKSIAKITISRNKENTDALMNSNDKLLDKIFDFENSLSKIDEKIVNSLKNDSDEKIQEIIIKQQELSNLIKEIEISLKKEILSINSKINSQPASVMMATPTMMPAQGYVQNVQVEEPLIKQGISEDELDDLVEKANEELERQTLDFEESSETKGEVISFESEETDSLEESMSGLEDSLDINFDEDIDIEAALSNIELALDEVENEEAQNADSETVDTIIEESMMEEPVLEEPIVEEPMVEEEKPPMPDLSDPNHVMTPEEIAALLANM